MASDSFASLEGKTALVTGASKGIGRAIAEELARAGASVVVGYRSGKDDAEALATAIGGRAVQADVSSPAEARRLVEEAGDVVNISSVVGVHGNWGQTNYAASKAGIIGFTKSLARELGSRNVRANVVAPGYVNTQLTEVLPEEATQAMIANTPLGRVAEPVEVAGAVRFLASDAAAFITGEVLLVDGGLGM